MKKKLSLILSALMLMGILSACTGDKESSSASQNSDTTSTSDVSTDTSGDDNGGGSDVSGKITFLTNRTDLVNDGTYASLLEEFQKTYPDVDVEFEGITDYAGELATRMQTTEYGDVLMIPDAVPNKEYGKYFVSFGAVEDFADIYQTGYLYSKWFDGQVYGLASMCTVQGIVYNKAVFADAGIDKMPETSEEFIEVLRKIRDNTDAIPYYTNANSGWTLDQWEDHAFGTLTGNPNYKNNEFPNDATAFGEGGSHYTLAKLLFDIVSEDGLCEADPTTADWEASKLMMNNGEIGCMLLGNWAIQQIKDSGEKPDDVGYMPFPAKVNGKQYATSGTDYCYAINVNSQYPEASRAWIDFLVNESGLALASGGISLLKNDPMPSGLEEFGGVEFIVDTPSTDENAGLLDEMEYESGITLYDNGARLNVVIDIARGASKQSFEDYMAELEQAWADAVEELKA